MKQFILNHRKAVAGIAAALLIGGITMSFQDSPFVHDHLGVQQEAYQDTTHPKCKGSMTMKEFDNLVQQLDENMLQVNGELKKIDLDQIEKTVEASLKTVDMEKIMKDVERSVKSIDVDKILDDVKSSLKNIDMKEIHKELEKAKLEIEKSREALKNINKE